MTVHTRTRTKLVLLVFFLIVSLLSSAFIAYSFFSSKADAEQFDPKDEAQVIFHTCSQQDDTERCYEKLLVITAEDYSLTHAVDTLEALQQFDPTTVYCHSYAHKIAIAEAKKYPENLHEVLKRLDLYACTRGYFHGAIEGYTSIHPEFTLNETSIPELCRNTPNTVVEDGSSYESALICIHAVGHMLLVQEYADITSSIDICKKLPDDLQFECYGGVFMENQNKTNLYEHGLVEKPSLQWSSSDAKEQIAVCEQYNGRGDMAKSCWRTIGEILGQVSRTTTELDAYCSFADTQDNKEECLYTAFSFQGFVKAQNRESLNSVGELCSVFYAFEEKIKRCATRVIEYVLSTSTEYLPYVMRLCADIPSESASGYCYDYVARKINRIPEGRVNKGLVCEQLPEEYRLTCRVG